MSTNGTLLDIPLEDILYDEEFNCRGHIPMSDVVTLAADILENTLIQPVSVIPWTGPKYKLYQGHRRYQAHKLNKAATIEAIVNFDLSLEEARFHNLQENLQRKDLDIVQEAHSVDKLFEVGHSQAEIARKLNVSEGWVYARKMLLTMNEVMQDAARKGIMTQYHIPRIAKMPVELQYKALHKLKDGIAAGKAASSIIIKAVKKDADKKRPRKAREMMNAIDFCFNTAGLGVGPHTFFLAWCSGETTNLELMQQIRDWLEERDIEFTIPPHAEIPDPNEVDDRDFRSVLGL